MDALVAASASLRREVDALSEALAGSAGWLAPVEPSPAVRARLLASVGASSPASTRWSPFVAELARLFDLSTEAVRAVFARADDARAWLGFAPGVQYQHFTPGPRLASAAGVEAGLVRLDPGVRFLRHRHVGGPEITFVLEGTMRDGDRSHGPGSAVTWEQGTAHDYAASAENGLVIAVLHHGIQPELVH